MPKILNTPMNIKYCINIKGNLKPVNFMNELCNKIKEEFGILKCLINTNSEILKFNITCLEDIEKDKNEKEEKEIEDINKKIKEEKDEDEEEDEDNNVLIMQIKLYKDSEKYILRFKEIKGNRIDFIDKYKEISNFVVKLLKN